MDVAVNAAGSDDIAFATNDFSARANDDVHAGLHVGVARLANADDAPALQANIGLDNAPVINDEGVGHDAVNSALGAGFLRLRHAVANRLAATKLDFFTVAPST